MIWLRIQNYGGGRFEGTVEDWVECFGASISFDQKLAKFDVIGSLAHVQMLGQTGYFEFEGVRKDSSRLERAPRRARGRPT